MTLATYTTVLDTLQDTGVEERTIVKSLITFLRRRNAEHLLPSIVAIYQRRARHGYRPGVLKVETAHEVTQETLSCIQSSVGAPKEALVHHHINPGHLGGFRALYQHQLTDCTYETQLMRLRAQLLTRIASL